MDSPWDEDPDYLDAREAEWTKISSEFTNAGYREGITAGKESALQEGFDAGFADVGAPLGQELGKLRGISSAVLAFLVSSVVDEGDSRVVEARKLVSELSNIRFSDIVPRDLEAEEHARQHLESDENGIDISEEIADKKSIEGLEDMLEKLTAGSSGSSSGEKGRPTAEDVQNLKRRLGAFMQHLGIPLNWS